MKLALVFAALVGTMVKAQEDVIPAQLFYVPMPETDTFHQTFKKINSGAWGSVVSMIALSISTTGTVVWYDHWEDGYDRKPGLEHTYSRGDLSSSTAIWGDGNCDNGYAPGTTCNSDSDDILKAGQSIVLQSSIPVPKSSSSTYVPGNDVFLYDGRDKVLATYPISLVRGNYPTGPGSLMAGAIEVLNTREWGTQFIAPVGENMKDSLTNGFEHVAFYVMAMEDNTVLTFSDGTTKTINEGEGFTHEIDRNGITMDATNPVQVDLITGDKNSSYELRWFSLLPREDWAHDYFSPVGDTKGNLKILMYNPDPDNSIKVTVETVGNIKKDYWVGEGSFKYTDVIRKGSGASLKSDEDFIALSLTDASGGGHIYDWGFPVMPTNKLSDEVLIGWGWGCSVVDCGTGSTRSVVWVSPVETADIYVDIDNNGTPDWSKTMYNVDRLSSNIVQDGTDISGAVIWAVKAGKPWNSLETVDIAAAWGQNAEYARHTESLSLDLGTLVPAFHGVQVSETVTCISGDFAKPGSTVEYTIQVKNAGHKDYPECGYKIKYPGLDDNLLDQDYVDGSCRFVDQDGNEQSCSDDALSSDDGLCSPAILPKRGEVHYYKFQAVIKSDVSTTQVRNHGILTQTGHGPDLSFSAPEPVYFDPSISIDKTVHEGSLASCSTGEESVSAVVGTGVTFCYEVTNNGNTWLDNVKVTDAGLNMPEKNLGRMGPGTSQWVKYEMPMPSSAKDTDGRTQGKPVFSDGGEIDTWDGDVVKDTDGAAINPEEDIPTSSPAINIEKTVHLNNVANCFSGMDVQYGFDETVVTYCYSVTNTGDVKLSTKVTDAEVGVDESSIVLNPGETKWVRKVSKISKDLDSAASVEGTPEDGNDKVYDEDSAGVKVLEPRPICE